MNLISLSTDFLEDASVKSLLFHQYYLKDFHLIYIWNFQFHDFYYFSHIIKLQTFKKILKKLKQAIKTEIRI